MNTQKLNIFEALEIYEHLKIRSNRSKEIHYLKTKLDHNALIEMYNYNNSYKKLLLYNRYIDFRCRCR